MFELGFPFLSVGLLAPLAVALGLLRVRSVSSARVWGGMAAAFAAVMWGLAGWLAAASGHALGDAILPDWLEVDSLDTAPLVLFAVLTLITLLAAPKRDLEGASVSGILFILVGTSMAYSAGTLAGMVLGWWVTCAPDRPQRPLHRRRRRSTTRPHHHHRQPAQPASPHRWPGRELATPRPTSPSPT